MRQDFVFHETCSKGSHFRPCFLSSACFKNWATLSPSAKSENVFWYFSWRNFIAKCLIPLFRHYNLQVLYFCRNGEPVSKKEKENKPAQSQQKRKMHKSSRPPPSQQFWARLALSTQSFTGNKLSNLDWNVDAGSSILIPREHLSHSSSPPTTLYLRLQEFSPLQDQVVSQEGCSFGH